MEPADPRSEACAVAWATSTDIRLVTLKWTGSRGVKELRASVSAPGYGVLLL
jgi:hypothetical protein